jgi:heme o synthase
MQPPISVGKSIVTGVDSIVSDKLGWRDFITVAKPGIVISNLLVVVTGFWLASSGIGTFDWWLFIVAVIGSGLAMAGSCVLNCYFDRDLDQKMKRTKSRPTATGRMSAKVTLIYGMTLLLAGTTFLAVCANPLSALFAWIGAFVYVILYTAWLKRTSHINTVVGAISGAMPPTIGWAAASGHLDQGGWLLFAVLFLWQIPHFLALGIKKAEEYRIAGYQMLPVVRGNLETKRQMLLWAAALVPSSLFLYTSGVVGQFYFFSAAVLGIGWVVLSIVGFFAKDEMKWARQMFTYSLVYLTVLCIIMMVDAI